MQIKSIKLNNIRSYTNETIEISKGSTLLSGDIGSGKSTILLAIEFALFGLSKGETSGSTLLRKGTEEGYVELSFELEYNQYTIYRSLKTKNNSILQDKCFLESNNKKEELAPIELKSKVLQLLGYPKDLLSKKNMIYRFTVYTPQEEMKRILFESNEDRLNTLRKVFGIDKYKRIRENSIILSKKLKDQCKIIEGIIFDLPQKEEHLKKINLEIKEIENEITPLNEKNLEIKKSREEKEKIYEKVKEELKKFNETNQNIIILDNKLQSIVKQKSDLSKNIEEIKKELENKFTDIKNIDFFEKSEIEKNINGIEFKINKYNQTNIEIKSRDQPLNNQKEILANEIKALEEKIKEKDYILNEIKKISNNASNQDELEKEKKKTLESIDELKKDINVFSANNITSKNTIEKIKDLDDCPMCLQKVSLDHKAHIVENENEKIELNKEKLEDRNNKLKDMDLKLKEIESMLLENQKSKIKIAELKITLENIITFEKQIEEKNKTKVNIENELNDILSKKNEIKEINIEELNTQLKQNKEILESIRKFELQTKIKEEKEKQIKLYETKDKELKEEVMKINSEKINLKKELVEFKDIENIAKETESEIKLIESKLKEIEINETELKTKLKSINNQKNDLNEEIQNKKNQEKNLFKKKQYIDWINNSFNNIIMIIEKNMMNSLYSEFNMLFQEWFGILIEDELITSKLDENFTPLIQQNGYDIETHNLSGGEKTALALSYRLALNKVINDITTQVKTKDLLILDEPTDGFSDHQLDKIREVLDKLDMEQVIIVSHEKKIESMVDKTIEIIKNEHISRVV